MPPRKKTTFNALVRKRAHVSGELAWREKKSLSGANFLRKHLAAIDAKLLAIEPTLDLSSIRPVRPKRSRTTPHKNAFADALLDALKETTEPTLVADLRSAVAKRLELPIDTVVQRNRLTNLVIHQLHHWLKKNAVAKTELYIGRRRVVKWSLLGARTMPNNVDALQHRDDDSLGNNSTNISTVQHPTIST